MEIGTERIKVGIIGCGQAAVRGHLPALKHLSEAEVICAAEIDPVRLEQVTDRFGIKRKYTDFRQMLDDTDLDCVAVCVPPASHLAVAQAVMDADRHLLLEKPLALSMEDCDLLIERDRESSRVNMLGFNMRFHGHVRKAREMITKGLLGEIRMVHALFGYRHKRRGGIRKWRSHRESGGGGLLDIAIHDFDLWRFLLRSELEEVFAVSQSGEADDQVTMVTARMSNDVLASYSFVEPTSAGYDLEVLGTMGRLKISYLRFDGIQFQPISSLPGDLKMRWNGFVQTFRALPLALVRRNRRGVYAASFQGEWRHFFDCIRQGKTPEATFLDGKRSMEVVLAAMGSASKGLPFKVAEAPKIITPVFRTSRDTI